MAITHATATRNALADLIDDLINAGSAAGILEFQTSGDVEVATLTFGDPAFGAAASGIITANSITADTNATGGTIAKAVLKDSDGNAVLTASVTATGGGGDFEMNSVVISAGQTVSITDLTYEAAA